MNIQIFGTKKSFDTKKAQRWFKERRIKFQFVDLHEKEMSKGELASVMQAAGGIGGLIDPKAKDRDAVALITCLAASHRGLRARHLGDLGVDEKAGRSG